MDRVLTVLISHQKPAELKPVLDHWQEICAPDRLLLLHGGSEKDFARLDFSPKLFLSDPRMRTKDHQREYQSLAAVFRAVSDFLRSTPDVQFVHLVEYDHLPLVKDLHERLTARAAAEGADLLAHHLHRIDDTSHPHFLYHASDSRFMAFWQTVSMRAEREVVLSMFGSGSFWRRRAFIEVAAHEEPFPMYFEVYLPTLAHHLGFRVRDFHEQNRFVHNLGDQRAVIDQARSAGAWTLHPVKRISV